MVVVVPPKAKMYDDEKELGEFFDIPNMPMVRSVVTSGNSYGVEACRYIGQKIAVCKDLKSMTLSDMFTTRLKTQLP